MSNLVERKKYSGKKEKFDRINITGLYIKNNSRFNNSGLWFEILDSHCALQLSVPDITIALENGKWKNQLISALESENTNTVQNILKKLDNELKINNPNSPTLTLISTFTKNDTYFYISRTSFTPIIVSDSNIRSIKSKNASTDINAIFSQRLLDITNTAMQILNAKFYPQVTIRNYDPGLKFPFYFFPIKEITNGISAAYCILKACNFTSLEHILKSTYPFIYKVYTSGDATNAQLLDIIRDKIRLTEKDAKTLSKVTYTTEYPQGLWHKGKSPSPISNPTRSIIDFVNLSNLIALFTNQKPFFSEPHCQKTITIQNNLMSLQSQT